MSSPKSVPSLESSLLNVLVVDKNEDGEKNLKNDDDEEGEGVEVQKTFCERENIPLI